MGDNCIGGARSLPFKYRSSNDFRLVPQHRRQQQQQLRWNHSSSGNNPPKAPAATGNKKPTNDGEGDIHNATADKKCTTFNPNDEVGNSVSVTLSEPSNTPTIHASQSPPSTSATLSTTPTTLQKNKRQRRRRGSPSLIRSPPHEHDIIRGLGGHKHRLITRKQILRLTPKQRADLQRRRRIEREASLSVLDKARINVRGNIKYLSETADGNFKRNIRTLKRLFSGDEEAWKDAAETTTPSSGGRRREREDDDASLARGIDWDRAPAEIQSNVRANLSAFQNWLHDTTGGMIPSGRTIGSKELGPTDGGSIATRVRAFHEMKQRGDERLVMDNWWKAKNVLLALLPGAVLHVYFWSLQDEMMEYYARVERKDGEDKGGIGKGRRDVRNAASSNKDNLTDEDGNDGKGGRMGISSALIPEGGSVLDRLKIVVNDLLLGGVEERINRGKAETESRGEDKNVEEEEGEVAAGSAAAASADLSSKDCARVYAGNKPVAAAASAAANSNSVSQNTSEQDPAIQMLLQRIQALEKQIGDDSDGGASDASEEELRSRREEQRKKEHQLKYKIERIRQSPMANRRDNVMWQNMRKEEEEKNGKKEKKEGDDIAEGIRRSNDALGGFSSYTLGDVVDFAKVIMEPSFDSMKELGRQKMNDAMGIFGQADAEEEDPEPTTNKQDDQEVHSSRDPEIRTSHPYNGEKKGIPANSTTKEKSSQIEVGMKDSPNNIQIAEMADSIIASDGAKINNVILSANHSDEDLHADDGNKHGGGVKRWAVKLWRRIRKPRDCASSTNGDGSKGQNDKEK